ncbi:MAG: efflux RND transporter periplasmic adaptor subunit [Candidatus Competibacteraceae bacterium]|nr:efflux RND transporter periplasmic adaptor subunit [Candidatus Competibacteraceae bacterium]
MIKKILLTIAGLLLIVGALAGLKVWQFKTMFAAAANFAQPPTTVTTAVVQQDSWQPTLNAVGSVIAVQGVTISAEVAGMVKRIAFESGANVRAGQLLVELDDAAEQAQLRSAIASAELTQLNLKRVRDLRPRNMVSQSDVDSADAQAKQADAQVDNIRAVIAKKSLRAPFAGRLGIRQINLGQFLNSGAAIVSLQTLDPIYVDFALPQQNFPQLRAGMAIRVTSDAAPDQTFAGKLSVISPEVDALTRTVRLRAALANPDGHLQPGMYVNVAAVLPAQEQVLMIPATAVLYAPYGDSVFVVEEKPDEKTGVTSLVLVQKFVQLGPSRGDFVVVNSGLTVGETVVSTGVFKLRNGMKAAVDNQLAPNFQLAPKPANS